MRRAMRWSVLVLSLSWTWAVLAVAAAPTAPWWNATIPTEEQQALQPGVVSVDAELFQGNCASITETEALGYVTATVTDAASAEVAGSVTYDEGARRVIWTAAAPLTAGERYTAFFLFDNEGMETNHGCGFGSLWQNIEGSFPFVVLDRELASTPAQATGIQTSLTETPRANTVCCPVEPGTTVCLSGGPCDEMCWTESYTYLPLVDVTWTGVGSPEEDYTRYELIRVLEDGFESVAGVYPEPGPGRVVFEVEAERYCVKVRSVQVVSGEMAETEAVCVEASALVAIQRLEPSTPDVSLCTTLPPGYESAEEDCGCVIRASQERQSSPRAWWLGGLGVLALMGLRRRG